MEDEGWTWQSIKTRWRYYLPLTMWLPTYSWRSDFPKDLIAGIAVATMLIPQALSYATLARLPPEFGLYTAWVSSAASLSARLTYLGTPPCLLLLGHLQTALYRTRRTRQSARMPLTQPVFRSAHLLAQVGLTLESVDPKDVVAVAHILSLIAGLVLFLLGAFRFGFLDNVLSRPLLCGFINALAVYIIIEQCAWHPRASHSNDAPADTFLGLPTVQVHGWEKLVTVLKEISTVSTHRSPSKSAHAPPHRAGEHSRCVPRT